MVVYFDCSFEFEEARGRGLSVQATFGWLGSAYMIACAMFDNVQPDSMGGLGGRHPRRVFV